MHMVDTLRIGGAERVALNLANLLPQEEYKAYLCTTRDEGDLTAHVAPHVKRVSLYRRSTLDTGALAKLVRFVRDNEIRILHAHASALFFARLASFFPPHPVVVWHDHYGRYAFNDRPVWLYKLATRGMGGVVAVNRPLEDWSKQALGMPENRVWYIPNFVQLDGPRELTEPLPGVPSSRIVCVANIRPQKDHMNLLRAMQLLKTEFPQAHALLIGDYSDKDFCDHVLDQITSMGLTDSVTYLGARNDIPAILQNSDIGVLASASEGLPLALLEYGMTGLPAVATAVGQCPEVLDDGAAGILVPPTNPEALADALAVLLRSRAERAKLGAKLKKHVESQYGAAEIIEQICEVYRTVLNDDRLGGDFANARVARSAS
jgi:glycosyltransferase involved in cell wall biosynthesis